MRNREGRREEADALFQQSFDILEQREYPIDLALALLRYGDALTMLGEFDRAAPVLRRARGLFDGMGATRFTQEIDTRLVQENSLGRRE